MNKDTSEQIKPTLIKVSDIEEKDAEWLIDGLIPKGQITSLVAPGGTGKTTMLCQMISCLTNGIPFWTEDETESKNPIIVLYLSAEDSFETTLRPRLRIMGADMSRVFTVSIADPTFSDLTLTSETLENVIKEVRPGLVIFDPLQSFLGAEVKLSERNSVRRCVQSLIRYGTEYDTTSLFVVHTNKRGAVSGRDRMADSSDLWDASRSVLMMGKTDEENIRYMSHEKCNYGKLQETVLFSIHDYGLEFEGRSNKRDDYYVYARSKDKENSAPIREDAKHFICQSLADGRIQAGLLKKRANANGITGATFTRAVKELREEKVIKIEKESKGKGNGVDWFYSFATAEIAPVSNDSPE